MKDVSLPTLANTREESVNHQESGTSDVENEEKEKARRSVESVETVQQFISSIEGGSVQVDETILVIQDFEKNDLESNENPVNETASTTEETPISDDGRVGQPLINPSSNTTSLSSSDPSPFGACPSNDIVSFYLKGIIFTLLISKTFYYRAKLMLYNYWRRTIVEKN